MRTSLDCLPCFVRQALEAARMVSLDPSAHERIVREVLRWTAEKDLDQPHAVLAQRIHRRLRETTDVEEPVPRGEGSSEPNMIITLHLTSRKVL